MNAKIFPFKSYFWSIHQGSTLVFEVTLENLSRSQDWHGSGRVEAEFVFWCQGLICHGSFSEKCCRAKRNIKDFSVLSSSQSASAAEQNEESDGCCDLLHLHLLLRPGPATGLHRPTQGHYGRGAKKVIFYFL